MELPETKVLSLQDIKILILGGTNVLKCIVSIRNLQELRY